jgi:hypothetical protein
VIDIWFFKVTEASDVSQAFLPLFFLLLRGGMWFFEMHQATFPLLIGWSEDLCEKTPASKSEYGDERDVDDPKHDPAIHGNPRDHGGAARLLKNHTERGG